MRFLRSFSTRWLAQYASARGDDVESQMLSQSLAMRRYELIRGNIAPEVGTNVKAAGAARD
jgi:hypothetical protein